MGATQQGRAVLCQDGQVTVGGVSYACSGSAHVSGVHITCTSPAHELPTITAGTITAAGYWLAPVRQDAGQDPAAQEAPCATTPAEPAPPRSLSSALSLASRSAGPSGSSSASSSEPQPLTGETLLTGARWRAQIAPWVLEDEPVRRTIVDHVRARAAEAGYHGRLSFHSAHSNAMRAFIENTPQDLYWIEVRR